jgi:hypothetical protein
MVAFQSPWTADRVRRMASISAWLTLTPVGYCPLSSAARSRSPVEVLVPPMRLTTTSRLSSGLPRPLAVIGQHRRGAIFVPWLVPGGTWLTQPRRPVSAEQRGRSRVQSRARAL